MIFVVSVSVVWSEWAILVRVVGMILNMLLKTGIKRILHINLTLVIVLVIIANVYGLRVEGYSIYYPYIIGGSVFLWIVVLLDDMFYSGKFLPHFTPRGVSLGIGGLIALLELISHIIRPLTLCVRLSTNITAGHVILGMISRFCYKFLFLRVVLFIIILLIVVLEVVVALLQSYIYATLLALYHSEFI